MGLVDRLQGIGICETQLEIAINGGQEALEQLQKGELIEEFVLRAKELEDYNGRYIHGPVTQNPNPGSEDPVYLGLVRQFFPEEYQRKIKITEADAIKVIESAQKKIAELEEASITIVNRNMFYVPEPQQ